VQVGLLLLPTCWGCPANVIKAPLHGISGSSIGIKCYLVHPCEVTADQLDIVHYISEADSPMTRRHGCFPSYDALEARSGDRLLNKTNVTPKELRQVFAESFQPAEIIEPSSRKARAGAKCQFDLRRTAHFAPGARAEQCNRLDPPARRSASWLRRTAIRSAGDGFWSGTRFLGETGSRWEIWRWCERCFGWNVIRHQTAIQECGRMDQERGRSIGSAGAAAEARWAVASTGWAWSLVALDLLSWAALAADVEAARDLATSFPPDLALNRRRGVYSRPGGCSNHCRCGIWSRQACCRHVFGPEGSSKRRVSHRMCRED
jgi:hypothetical protein